MKKNIKALIIFWILTILLLAVYIIATYKYDLDLYQIPRSAIPAGFCILFSFGFILQFVFTKNIKTKIIIVISTTVCIVMFLFFSLNFDGNNDRKQYYNNSISRSIVITRENTYLNAVLIIDIPINHFISKRILINPVGHQDASLDDVVIVNWISEIEANIIYKDYINITINVEEYDKSRIE